MDALQLAVKRAQFAKGTPSVVHAPPKHRPVTEDERIEESVVILPREEIKSVETSTAEIPAENARFEAIERKLSRLMHMVGADEIGGVTTGPKFMTAADIKSLVAEYFGMTPQEITGPSRYAPIVHARQVAFYLARKFTMLSLPKIGDIFQRDHTSVMHGIARIEKKREPNSTLDADLMKLEIQIAETLKRRQEAAQAV